MGLTIIPIPMQYIQGQISTRRSYLEKNPKMVKAFLLSLSETIRAVRADRGRAMSVIARVLKTDDKAVLEHAYDALRSQVVPDLLPTEESILNVLRIMKPPRRRFRLDSAFQAFRSIVGSGNSGGAGSNPLGSWSCVFPVSLARS